MTDASHVCLPSNASWREFPDNTNGSYKVHLPRPLVLDGGRWEVGMTDITFPGSWRNVDEGEFGLNYIRSKEGVAVESRTDMRIHRGLYRNVREVVNALQRELQARNLGGVVSFSYDHVRNKVKVRLTRQYVDEGVVPFLIMTKDLSEILGLPPRTAIVGAETESSTPDINRGMTSLFVYSDVVSERPVGDVMVPLLRVVPLSDVRNETTYVEFKQVHYLPVANHSSEIVSVTVARDNGDIMKFYGGKVIVNLHFRRVA